MIVDCGSNQRALFQVIGNHLLIKPAPKLPTHDSAALLAEQFNNYFIDKIDVLRLGFDGASLTHPSLPESPFPSDCEPLIDFQLLCVADVIALVKACPNKSCALDPIPSSLLKQLVHILAVPLVSLFNMSLSSGYFPTDLKTGIVFPLLKKVNLCPETMDNFRPITNISQVAKLLERHVFNQLVSHLTAYDLFVSVQSAYRAHHSTESALLRIVNDLLLAADKGEASVLALLDMSSAFDTIDHPILLRRPVLKWIESYTTGRLQSTCISGVVSVPVLLKYGIGQGTVIGPLVYILYSYIVDEIAKFFGISRHFFSDDAQCYKHFRLLLDGSAQLAACSTVSSCILRTKDWTEENKMKINVPKTCVLFTYPDTANIQPNQLQLLVGDQHNITPSSSVRNLGMIIDSTISLEEHVSSLCKRGFFQLRRIANVRKYLDRDATIRLVTALAFAVTDNNHSLLYGLPEKQLDRIQSIQNATVRLVDCSRRRDHITPQLLSLHWLPIRFRIQFEVATLVYRCINGIAPVYLSELVNLHVPGRSGLRSECDVLKLIVHRCRLKRYGERSFLVSVPVIWNALPLPLRSCTSLLIFRKNLKTYLFKKAFDLT